uniref:Uncharacterized protein n=1 Tax=Eutreptiella gymnastica TaxID=73025 RepID=A0A7S4G543_9EUGL
MWDDHQGSSQCNLRAQEEPEASHAAGSLGVITLSWDRQADGGSWNPLCLQDWAWNPGLLCRAPHGNSRPFSVPDSETQNSGVEEVHVQKNWVTLFLDAKSFFQMR